MRRQVIVTLALLVVGAVALAPTAAVAQAMGPPPARTPTVGGHPSVSPDGLRILYSADIAGDTRGRTRLYLMNADGTGARPFGPDTLVAFGGRWSPDGKEIIIGSMTERGTVTAWSVDGSHARTLLRTAPGAPEVTWAGTEPYVYGDFTPVPGALPIGNIRIKQVGGRDAALTSDSAFNYGPALAPDGKQVAFTRLASRDHPSEIFVVRTDGTGVRQLTTGSTAGHESVVWSPDGKTIAFQANAARGQGTVIGVVDVATGAQRLLTAFTNGKNDETPAWFPDGKRLAIQSDRNGAWNVYVLDLTGKTRATLTHAP